MAVYAVGDVQGCAAELDDAARALLAFDPAPGPALVRRRSRQSRTRLARGAAPGRRPRRCGHRRARQSRPAPAGARARTCRAGVTATTALRPVLEAPDREPPARLAAVAAAAAPRRGAWRHVAARGPAAAVGHRARRERCAAELEAGAAQRSQRRAVHAHVRQPARPVARRPRGRGSPALHHQRAHPAARLRPGRAAAAEIQGTASHGFRRAPCRGSARRAGAPPDSASSADTGRRSAIATRAACWRSTPAACGAAR